ncbi:uncharacterized protein LOC113473304 isoform X1 [Diaphorina citri]|uniref:Uncharacterized protein LOC113473304 isoform X1 n=1 Tax=Diaphorina citri TaxID=121845 RepID=A0A3Q0JK71_DIACI|nr:uncharacterized protein LOC113473304 isoform X1 [Diaphorina citri]
MDATGFGLGHMTAITPSFLKQVFSYFLDGANVSIVEINIINVNVFVEKLVFLIKALTPPIVYERVSFYYMYLVLTHFVRVNSSTLLGFRVPTEREIQDKIVR